MGKMADDWDEGTTPNALLGVQSAEVPDVVPKLFNKWACDEVNVPDMSLQDYIGVKEKSAKYLPHSAGITAGGMRQILGGLLFDANVILQGHVWNVDLIASPFVEQLG